MRNDPRVLVPSELFSMLCNTEGSYFIDGTHTKYTDRWPRQTLANNL